MSRLFNTYVGKKLRRTEEEMFKASGLLFCQHLNNKLYGLFGIQMTKSNQLEINFLGGKKENNETSYQTGIREFREETGDLITESDVKSIEKRILTNQNSFVTWMGHGKYSLYTILLNSNDDIYSTIHNLPETFQSQLDSQRKEMGACYSEVEHLFWMNLSTGILKSQDSSKMILDLNNQNFDYPFRTFTLEAFRKFPFIDMISKLENVNINVNEFIDSLSKQEKLFPKKKIMTKPKTK